MGVLKNPKVVRFIPVGVYIPPSGLKPVSSTIAKAGNDSGYWNITLSADLNNIVTGDPIEMSIVDNLGQLVASAQGIVGQDITTTVNNDNNWTGNLANYITPVTLTASALNAGTQLIQFNKAKYAFDNGKLGFYKGEDLNFYIEAVENKMTIQESGFYIRVHQYYQGQQRLDAGYTFGDSTLGLTQYAQNFVVSAIERTANGFGGTLTAPNPLTLQGYQSGVNYVLVNDVNVPIPGDKIGEWTIQDDLTKFPEPIMDNVVLTHGVRWRTSNTANGMMPIPITSVDTDNRLYNVRAFTSNILSGLTGNIGLYRGNNVGDSSLDPLTRSLLFSSTAIPGATFPDFDFTPPSQGNWHYTLYSAEGRFNTSWSSDTELVHADFILSIFEF